MFNQNIKNGLQNSTKTLRLGEMFSGKFSPICTILTNEYQDSCVSKLNGCTGGPRYSRSWYISARGFDYLRTQKPQIARENCYL